MTTNPSDMFVLATLREANGWFNETIEMMCLLYKGTFPGADKMQKEAEAGSFYVDDAYYTREKYLELLFDYFMETNNQEDHFNSLGNETIKTLVKKNVSFVQRIFPSRILKDALYEELIEMDPHSLGWMSSLDAKEHIPRLISLFKKKPEYVCDRHILSPFYVTEDLCSAIIAEFGYEMFIVLMGKRFDPQARRDSYSFSLKFLFCSDTYSSRVYDFPDDYPDDFKAVRKTVKKAIFKDPKLCQFGDLRLFFMDEDFYVIDAIKEMAAIDDGTEPVKFADHFYFYLKNFLESI